MSSEEDTTNIPYQLYYLEHDFSPETARRYHLQAILQAHGVDVKKSMRKQELIALFREHVQKNRDAILAEYREKERLKSRKEEERAQSEEPKRGHRIRRRTRTPEDEHKTPRLLKSDEAQAASPFSYPPENDAKVKDEEEPMTKELEASANEPPNVPASPEYDDNEYDNEISEKRPATTTYEPAASNRLTSMLNYVNQTVRRLIPGSTRPETPQNSFSQMLMDDDEEDDDFEFTVNDESDDDEYDEFNPSEADGDLDAEEIRALIKDLKQSPQEIARQARMQYMRGKIEMVAKRTLDAFKAITYAVHNVILLFLLLGLFSFMVIVLVRKKVGYCSEIVPAGRTFGFLPSACIPCPDHGTCVDGELACDRLYKRRRPLYNYFGILPVADECILDSAIGKSVAQAEKRIKTVLARKQGKAVCDYLLNSEENTSESSAPMVQIKMSDVLERVQQYGEFNNPMASESEVLSFASQSVLSDPHIYHWDVDGEVYLATDRTKFSISCNARLFAARVPTSVKRVIAVLFGLLAVFFAVWYQYVWKVQAREKFNAQVLLVVKILEEQLRKHADNPEVDPACSVIYLRSKIMDMYPVTPEEWGRICQVLRKLGKVRQSFRDVNGEPREYWELTG